MSSLAARILQAFDTLASQELDFQALLAALAREGAVAPDALRAELAELLRDARLRPAARNACFARTEDGRLALAGPRDVTLYTRPGCHLCDHAKAQIAPLLREFGATLREVDIDSDAALRDRYTQDVPVIFLASRKVAKHRVDLARFRRQLQNLSR